MTSYFKTLSTPLSLIYTSPQEKNCALLLQAAQQKHPETEDLDTAECHTTLMDNVTYWCTLPKYDYLGLPATYSSDIQNPNAHELIQTIKAHHKVMRTYLLPMVTPPLSKACHDFIVNEKYLQKLAQISIENLQTLTRLLEQGENKQLPKNFALSAFLKDFTSSAQGERGQCGAEESTAMSFALSGLEFGQYTDLETDTKLKPLLLRVTYSCIERLKIAFATSNNDSSLETWQHYRSEPTINTFTLLQMIQDELRVMFIHSPTKMQAIFKPLNEEYPSLFIHEEINPLKRPLVISGLLEQDLPIILPLSVIGELLCEYAILKPKTPNNPHNDTSHLEPLFQTFRTLFEGNLSPLHPVFNTQIIETLLQKIIAGNFDATESDLQKLEITHPEVPNPPLSFPTDSSFAYSIRPPKWWEAAHSQLPLHFEEDFEHAHRATQLILKLSILFKLKQTDTASLLSPYVNTTLMKCLTLERPNYLKSSLTTTFSTISAPLFWLGFIPTLHVCALGCTSINFVVSLLHDTCNALCCSVERMITPKALTCCISIANGTLLRETNDKFSCNYGIIPCTQYQSNPDLDRLRQYLELLHQNGFTISPPLKALFIEAHSQTSNTRKKNLITDLFHKIWPNDNRLKHIVVHGESTRVGPAPEEAPSITQQPIT